MTDGKNRSANGSDTADSGGSAPSQQSQFVEERTVGDLETLRLLADPLRLSILGAFPAGRAGQSMSVKEIAEKLDEGQTKLYRHVKKLEEAGLLYVAETRVVSGIIEKRYRAAQRRLMIEGDMLTQQPEPDEYTDTMVAVLDATRDRMRREIQAGRVLLKKPEAGPDLSIQLGSAKVSMTLERYEKLRATVTELLDVGPSDEGPDTVTVHLQVLLLPTIDPAENPMGASDASSDA